MASKGITLPITYKADLTGLKQAESALGGFKSSLGKFSVAIGAAFAASSVVIASFAKSSISAASTLNESLNAVAVSYGAASEEIVKLGETASSRLGVTQSAFNQAAVRFSAFADRVVGSGGDVAGVVDDITTRAADFASVFDIDVAEALQVFQSGLSGEAEPLKRFGINLLQTEVEAYALREGLIAVGEQMTEDQKIVARYGLLMESTAKTAGDFANTSDGLANSQRILKASFTDMQATVGGPLLSAFANLSAGLVPVVEQLGPVLAGAMETLAPKIQGVVDTILEVIPAMMTFGGELGSVFEEVGGRFDTLREKAQPVVDAFFALRDSLPGLASAFGSVGSVVDKLAGQGLATLFAVGGQVATQLLPALIDAFVQILPPVADLIGAVSEALLPIILQVASVAIPIFVAILNVLTPIITTLTRILAATGGSLTTLAVLVYGAVKAFQLFRTVVLVAQGIQLGFAAATYGATAATYAQTAAAKIGLVTANLLNGTYLMQAGALLTNTVHMIAARVAMVAGAVATGVATAAQWAFNAALSANPIGIIIVAVAALVAGLALFFSQTEVGRAAWAAFTGYVVSQAQAMAQFFSYIFGEWLPSIWTGFVEFLGTAWVGFSEGFMAVLGFLGDFFKDVINGYIGMWENFINFFVDGINSIIRGLNRIKVNIPATALTPALSFGVNIPTIPNVELPRLAEGGIVKARPGGIIANIGEGGQDEAVIPLNKMGKMGNTYNITINANVADARLGEVVVNAIKRYERNSGPVFAKA